MSDLQRPRRDPRALVAVCGGITAAGLCVALAGVSATPATAELQGVTVTLLGGKTITVTVEVPAGTVLDEVRLPGIETPVIAISPAGRPAPASAEEAAPTSDSPRHRRHKHRRARRDVALVVRELSRKVVHRAKTRRRQAPPSAASPTFSLALPGAAPIGVPNFFIDKFRVPPFLLPIYQAAAVQYGVRWEILAAINEIETDYGRNLRVSHAGAVGWMQFMPSTWRRWGVDANRDGRRDPYNPVDAIFSAARYLRASGAERDPRAAIFAYNHADWYVDSILLRARMLGGLPSDLVASLTGLTQGRFPVKARARYADERRDAVRIFAKRGAPIVAVQDGKIVRVGRSRRLGKFVRLRDAYGNTYTYAHLDKLARTPPVRRSAQGRLLPRGPRKERLFAHPERAPLPGRGAGAALRPLRRGARVVAGTVLGRIGGDARRGAPYLLFQIRPVGRGAPTINPKPILDGWKLLESTAVYRAKDKNPLLGKDPSIGQILLMGKEALIRRVLRNGRIDIYDCGRRDIRAGIVDRRVLATLEFLAASGLKPTVTSLRCGHGYYTARGNVSHHSFGAAVDIAKINGIPIQGHQGPGSIADLAVRRLLTLEGAMKPSQIITLMTYQGADNAIAMADHADHIHVGFRPLYGPNARLGRQLAAVLRPHQWIKLIDRLSGIDNPAIPLTPSRYSIATRLQPRRAAAAPR